MKNLLFVLALVFAILFTQTTQAQFFEKLKKKTEEKIKNIELITISDITDFARKFLK